MRCTVKGTPMNVTYIVADLFAQDTLSSSGYPMITYTHLIASNVPIKFWLLGDCKQIHIHARSTTKLGTL